MKPGTACRALDLASSAEIAAIVCDTREPPHTRYRFEDFPVVVKKLDAGDYSLVGFEDQFCVERKSKADAYGCVGKSRDRFKRCLDRLSMLKRAVIVIECSFHDFQTPPSRTMISKQQAIGSYISWWSHYGVGVFWGTRAECEAFTVKWLVACLKHSQEGW